MMEHGRIRFVAGASVERIGPEVLVSVPGSCEAFRLSGEAARLAIAVLDGTPIPDSDPLVVDELHRRGIVEIAGQQGGVYSEHRVSQRARELLC